MMFEDMHKKHMAGTKAHMMSEKEMGGMMGKMPKMSVDKKKVAKAMRARHGGKGESMGEGE